VNDLVAVVTGGTRGIGLGIALSLVKRGASVAITYFGNDESANSAEKELNEAIGIKTSKNILVVKGDVGDADSVKRNYLSIRQVLGPVNVLVNNAGIMSPKPFDEIEVKDWDETIRINLSGAFYWTRLAVRDMKKQSFGRVINIASIAAHGGGVIGPHYAASKAGVVGMTRYAAKELGPHGITVNAIAPAFIEDAGIFMEWSEEKKMALKKQTFVPALGETDDVVRAFEYLLASPFVTGATLNVNGGALMI